MRCSIKSIVFKTSKLNETKAFFENIVGFKLKEYSHEHFVLNSKSIRVVFIETDAAFEVELFVRTDNERIENLKDPNDLKVLIKNFEGCSD